MSRIESVDVLRLIAIIAVIVIHTTPFEALSLPHGNAFDWATVLNQAARFAVPVFFVLSGYFWATKFNDAREVSAPSLKMAKRIAILFGGWSVIYLFPFDIFNAFSFGVLGPIKVTYWNLLNAADRPLTTLLAGTKDHLWFLPGLLCSLAIAALLLRLQLHRALILLAVALYLVGLAGKAYSDTPLGFHMAFNFRDGPFFSLLFFVTGYLLQGCQTRRLWLPLGGALFVLGLCLHFTELFILQTYWATTMSQDYVLGTYFWGTGAALIALANPSWLQSSRLAASGPFVLGIYASHYIFVDLLHPLELRFAGVAVWDIAYVVVVFLLSYGLARALARHARTRWLVV